MRLAEPGYSWERAGWKVVSKRDVEPGADWARLAWRHSGPGVLCFCGWSGAAHPYGALLCSCSLSKSICCWWKGAPLPLLIPTLLQAHAPSPRSPNSQGRCWEVKPRRLVPPSYLLTPQSCLAHCHYNLPPQPWCCVPALNPPTPHLFISLWHPIIDELINC